MKDRVGEGHFEGAGRSSVLWEGLLAGSWGTGEPGKEGNNCVWESITRGSPYTFYRFPSPGRQ